MCYGIAGTVDDKGIVRCAFTCSHDEKENKPDEVRRTYWEWEVHFPELTKPFFTNEGEDCGKCHSSLKRKVRGWCKSHQRELREAFGSTGDRQGAALFGKAKTGDLNFRMAKTGGLDFSGVKAGNVYLSEAKTGNVYFWKASTGDLYFEDANTGSLYFQGAKTGDLDFREAKTGYLDFCGTKTGELDFYEAKTGNLNFLKAKTRAVYVKNMKPSSKKLAKLIQDFSMDRNCEDATLAKFAQWCIEKGREKK